ncbi:MAG: hypothetical protein JWM88_3082, partial [Verrucomicrobia bacterium]|nr:hypothetical protein [Verrucomicrobiota bacterium]
MSERVRSIRFARVEVSSCRSNAAGETVIARVLLDEAPLPAGTIVSGNATWCYQLPDGLPSGLMSVRSRQDLE